MTYSDKHILDAYSELFEGLSSDTKMGLIENLTKSLASNAASKDEKFYNSYGSFGSERNPVDIIDEIKSSRKFKTKEFKF